MLAYSRNKEACAKWLYHRFLATTALNFARHDIRFLRDGNSSCAHEPVYDFNNDALNQSCDETSDDAEFIVSTVDSNDEL